MNNLKRVLSLALSGIMLVGMMAMGASAVDFSDADKINNTEAVNTLVSLGVINGKDDGSYAPEEIVTRSQMAKMICVALNGGKDFKYGTKTTPTYSDIKGHWAESYIEYCSSLNIIAGQGDGTFNPDAPVTASAASKMMLVAIGYDAEDEGMVGTDWEVNTNRLADNKGFYKGLNSLNVSEGLSRDNAAQVIFNACGAAMIEYDYKLVTNNGDLATKPVAKDRKTLGGTDITLLSEKFDLVTKYTYLTGVTYDDKKDEYTYSHDETAGSYGAAITTDPLGSVPLKSSKDFSSLFGLKVKVLYKVENSKAVIYGMYGEGKVLAEGVWGKAEEKAGESLKFDGVTYKYDAANKVDVITGTAATAKKEYTFKAIDNDDNGKVDAIVFQPITVAQVTFVGKDSVTMDNGVGNVKLEDVDIYDDVKKDDFVAVVKAANTKNDTAVITKLEVLEATIEAVRGSDVRVNGTWYKPADTTSGDSATAGDEVKLTLVNGYVAHTKKISSSASLDDVLYVVASDGAIAEVTKNFAGKFEGKDTKVLMADGTNKIVKAMRVDATTEADGVSKADSDLAKTTAAAGLYTYKINKDGVYELKRVKDENTKLDGTAGVEQLVAAASPRPALIELKAANKPDSTTLGTATGTEGSTDVFDKDKKQVGTAFIADDAVVYIVTSDASSKTKEKVVSGKDLKTMDDFGAAATFLTKSVNGLATAQVVVINTANAIGGTNASTGYGYITTAGYAEKNGDDWVVKFTAWTEDGEQELTAVDDSLSASSATAAAYKKGAFITFTQTSKVGEVTDASVIGTAAAITGWDGSKYIAFDGAAAVAMKDKDETVVIYVDTDKVAGVEGGSISMATEIADNVYVKNAVYATSGSPAKVDVLFVDTANKVSDSVGTIVKDTAVTADDLKVAPEGVYQLDATGTIDGSTLVSATTDKKDLVFFVFKSNSTAAETYTLTVKDSDNTTVWAETASISDAAAHVWYIDASATTYGTATTHTAMTTGAYSYTITKGTETISSGSFNFVDR